MTALPPAQLLLVAVLVPFGAALLIPLFHRLPNLREAVTLIAAVVLCAAVFLLLPPVLAGARPQWTGVEIVPGVAFAFKVEPFDCREQVTPPAADTVDLRKRSAGRPD